MATAVAIAPGTATLTSATGGALLTSSIGKAALRGGVLNDAHIQTTNPTSTAAVGSAVVGTSTVG